MTVHWELWTNCE